MGLNPLAIDLFCGLGGWTKGLLAEGYRVVGFDIERHVYGEHRYPAQLVIQDVLTLHGSQFKEAALIVASPPCQEFSYMAMPWSRAKAIAADYRAGRRDVKQLTALFDACFRIQREASEAAGRHIPLVVENVRGAQKWVGRSRYHFGSFHLWGDVPALMPMTLARAMKIPTGSAVRSDKSRSAALGNYDQPRAEIKNTGGSWFNIAHNTASGKAQNPVNGPTNRLCDCGHLERQHGINGNNVDLPCSRCSCINPVWVSSRRTDVGNGVRFTSRDCGIEAVKGADAGWFNDAKRKGGTQTGRLSQSGSKSPVRKAASAMIAKIPLVLSRHIAKSWYPESAA